MKWWVLGLVLFACGGDRGSEQIDGAEIFSRACARCHGPRGEPTRGMVARLGVRSLTTDRVATELSDADVRSQILNGSANQLMPAFVGALSDAQVNAVVAHVRSLRSDTRSSPQQ